TAVFLLFVLAITGMLEMFYYIPTPEQAALSVQTITYHVPLGALIRNTHYWAAQLLLIVMAVHFVRVVMTGAYRPPRRFNYLLGLVLFVVVVLLNFTGYILRWDQGIQWALVVGTNLLKTIPAVGDTLYTMLIGGSQPGSATLIRFYAWHIFGLGLVAVFFTGWHIFRVRRDGGIAVQPPRLREDDARITRFELVQREVLAMILIIAALFILAGFVPAPIDAPIEQITTLANDASAPWFFLWVQQMLKWGDPFLWGIVAPSVLLLVLVLLPYVLPQPQESELGRWFPRSNRLARWSLVVVSALIIILTLMALLPGV
ncbi:MAG: cytochrome b N-terminal domain-containing protein, partial [Anaerolineae bacterium]|nr:cytochrome b N-terminal domain-containing protein [Anaerolineae bacterium]